MLVFYISTLGKKLLIAWDSTWDSVWKRILTWNVSCPLSLEMPSDLLRYFFVQLFVSTRTRPRLKVFLVPCHKTLWCLPRKIWVQMYYSRTVRSLRTIEMVSLYRWTYPYLSWEPCLNLSSRLLLQCTSHNGLLPEVSHCWLTLNEHLSN